MRMRAKPFLVATVAVWVVGITILHLTLNVGWSFVASKVGGLFRQQAVTLLVGYLPVT